MRLWYRPGTAAMAPHAALAEIGCEYELVRVPFDAPTDASAEYLRLNPHGRVPTLEDGDFVLTESVAILLWLDERFPAARLLPPAGRERAEAIRWLAFLASTLQPALLRTIYPERYGSDGVVEARTLGEHFDWIDGELADREWLVGDARTAADLFLFMLVRWGRRLDPPAWARPQLRAHWLRTAELPGVARMLAEQGLELPSL